MYGLCYLVLLRMRTLIWLYLNFDARPYTSFGGLTKSKIVRVCALTHDLLEFLMCTAFSQVVIPPVASEWDTFFKVHAFEMYLVPSISMVIHFSTSVYSKLIITCSARPQCLNMACSIKGKFIWLYAKKNFKIYHKIYKNFSKISGLLTSQ